LVGGKYVGKDISSYKPPFYLNQLRKV